MRLLYATDDPSVVSLLTAIYAHNPAEFTGPSVHGPAIDEPGRYRRTLVVETNANLVGVGTIWEYWLHPARWRLALHVHPYARRRGIGTLLLNQLAGQVPYRDKRPLQAALSADNAAGRRFLHRSGFGLLMRTRRGTVNVSLAVAAIQREASDATLRVTSAGGRIAMLSDVGVGTRDWDALADLHAEIYRRGHDWNLTAPFATRDARTLFMDEDEIIPDAFAIGLLDDYPVAVASLRRGNTPDTLDLGWVGVITRVGILVEEFTVALVGRCLAAVAGRYESLTVEVDEADGQLWSLLDKLPIQWEADWLTYVRPHHNSSGRTS